MQSSKVPHAGLLLADILPKAKYIPVEVPVACWLSGGGCWRWFTVITVMRNYNAWLGEEKKLACGDKVNATLEVKQTWRVRQCKQNYTIHCPTIYRRACRIILWVWMLETWDTVWDAWVFAPFLMLCFYGISKVWWFSKCMIVLSCFVWQVLSYPITLGWWIWWKPVELVWPVITYLVQPKVYQLLWWLIKLAVEAFLHIMHVMTYIDPLCFSDS